MKIFLSALEGPREKVSSGGQFVSRMLVEQGVHMKFNLMSFYAVYKDKSRYENALFIRDNTDEILIDSGAHSFQKGKKVDWDKYLDDYIKFIKEFDRPNVIGYFEMDIDKIVGYEKVLEMRRKLESVSEKIIPVWHKNRGIEEYKSMCHRYTGKIVAISGFRKEDIKDDQYMMFVKYAKQCGCKIHCLGMTRKAILDKVPFDYTDSSSWMQQSNFGRVQGSDKKVSRAFSRSNFGIVFAENYKRALAMQIYYEKKWSGIK